MASPLSDKVRPTADRARESVFNILNSQIDNWGDVKLLDVFCGTGAFGLEALSRGASDVCLIDIDVTTAEKNAKLFEAEKSRIKIVRADICKLPSAHKKFNLVFLDAPYNKGLSEIALQNLIAKGWIDDEAIVVVEVEKNEEVAIGQSLELFDTRVYGLAKFLFFRLCNL